MSTPLRFIPDEAKRFKNRSGESIAVVEITIRTILGIYLLKPTPRNKSLILGVLGRAKERLDFELYGYAYLSNHGSCPSDAFGPQSCCRATLLRTPSAA